MPSRILLPTYGSLGDIHPFLAIALELKARGHQPVIATSQLYRAKIEELDLGFHAIAPEMPPTEEWHTAIPRLMDGKKIVELRPPVDVNKGTAVTTLLQRAGVSAESGVPMPSSNVIRPRWLTVE